MKQPRPYQTSAIERITETGSLILADDCGVGKTLVAVEVARQNNLSPVLLICAGTAIEQWTEAIWEQIPDARIICPDKYSLDYSQVLPDVDWVIITWADLIHKTSWTLFKVTWSLVIADEAHRAKNRKSKRALHLRNLNALRKVCLTATPYEKREEVWSLLNIVAPHEFRAYWAFVLKYFVTEDGYRPWEKNQIVGIKDPEALARAEAPWMIRRTMDEVLPYLPEVNNIDVPVKMGDDQKLVYDTLKNSKDIVVQVEDVEVTVLNAISLLMRLQQVSSLPRQLGFSAGSAKIDWITEFVEDHPNLRILFFTKYIATAQEVASIMQCECVANGEGSAEPFRKNQTQYLVMTIASGAESLDLGSADAAIFVEGDWSSIQMTQAQGRIRRANIVSAKTIYHLHASPTDRFIRKCAEDKLSEREVAFRLIKELQDEDVI